MKRKNFWVMIFTAGFLGISSLAQAGYVKGEMPPAAASASVQREAQTGAVRRQEKVSADGPAIEVGLVSGAQVSVSLLTAFSAEQNGRTWIRFRQGETVSAARSGNGLLVNGKKSEGAVVLISREGSGPSFSVKGNRYRGGIKLVPNGSGGVTVVNVLTLEEYLLGVVPSEVSPQWRVDALRAQAVAARTYALYNMNAYRSRGYDVTDDTRSQGYGGYSAEAAASSQAVSDTRGMVVTYGGKPIDALFHSNAGGYTENSENVWGTALPYLRGVPEPRSSVTGRAWTRTFTVSDFVRRLKDAGYDVGALKGISLSPMRQGDAKDRDRGISGRVKYIVAKGPRSSRQVPGDALQSMLGLPSTLFDFSVKGKNLVVTGYGSGHGLGLSQWGAEAMAEEHGDGKDYYKQILTHYYQNTKVEKIY